MAISAGMQAALESGGYVVEYYAESYTRSGTKTATLDIEDGTVQSSWMDAVRRTVEFTLPLDGWDASGGGFGGLVPEAGYVQTERLFGDGNYGSGLYGYNLEVRNIVISLVKPFQTILKVYGKFTHEGSVETVMLGVFTVSSVNFTDDERGFVARITGWDSGGDIINVRYTQPKVIGASTNITPAINFLLDGYVPDGVSSSIPTITGDTTPTLSYLPGDNHSPWEAAREVAMTANKLLTVGRDGNLIIEDIPENSTEYPESVWSVDDSTTVGRQNYSPDYKSVVNQVVVSGESASSAPVVGVAEDVAGQFGTATTGVVISREEVSNTCQTNGQCVNLANSLLRKWGAMSESYDLQTALNPDLEPGQVITVASIGLGLDDEELVVEQVSYPLAATAFMQLLCSRKV